MAYVEGTRNRSDGVIQSGPVYPGIEDARKKVGFFVGHNRGPSSDPFLTSKRRRTAGNETDFASFLVLLCLWLLDYAH